MYEALTDGAFPTVTSITNTVSGQIVFTGTNFFTAAQNFTASASYGGAMADSVTVDSATQVTAQWNYGLPPIGQSIVPSLWFDETGTDVKHSANISASLNKALSVTSSTSGLTCSFAGGCNLTINAEGLSTMLKNDTVNNFISVCDEKCEFITNLSDSS